MMYMCHNLSAATAGVYAIADQWKDGSIQNIIAH